MEMDGSDKLQTGQPSAFCVHEYEWASNPWQSSDIIYGDPYFIALPAYPLFDEVPNK